MTLDEFGILETLLHNMVEGDSPFMILFCVFLLFTCMAAIRLMAYVKSVSEGHQTQIETMNRNMREQREENYKVAAEERRRSDKREEILFSNMAKNTEQLEGIATTLKEVQFNFTSLENKVTENFHYLSSEIDNVKTQVSVKTILVHPEKDPE